MNKKKTHTVYKKRVIIIQYTYMVSKKKILLDWMIPIKAVFEFQNQ